MRSRRTRLSSQITNAVESIQSIKKEMFDKLANGYNIGDEGKKVLIPAINEFLDQQIRYKNRNIRRRDVIQLDLHAFAQELLQVGEMNEAR